MHMHNNKYPATMLTELDMTMAFTVLQFSEDRSVGIARTRWLRPGEHADFVYWPETDVTRLTKKDADIDETTWKMHKIRQYFAQTDVYLDARKYEKRAQIDTDVETPDEESAVNRKRKTYTSSRCHQEESPKNRKKKTSSNGRSNHQEETPSDREYQPQSKRPTQSRVGMPKPPSHATGSDEEHETQPRYIARPRVPLTSCETGKDREYETQDRRPAQPVIPKPSTTGGITEAATIMDGDDEDNENVPDEPETEDMVSLLRQIIEKQAKMMELMHTGKGAMRMEECMSSILIDPLQTEEELADFEEKLRDVRHQKNVLKVLSVLGGDGLSETMGQVMRKIGTNELWSQYSIRGQGKKKSLSNYKRVMTLIHTTCINHHKRVQMTDMNRVMQDRLKAAPHKKGGPLYKRK